jgi:hypothetical protein
MALHNAISQDEIEFIKNNSNKTVKELSFILHRHANTLRVLAKKHKLKIKRHQNKSTKIDNSYFKNWSNESAYIRGFIAADGCIIEGNRNGKTLEITLNIKDNDHLQTIANMMKFTGKLKLIEKTNAIRFTIGSRELCDDLISIGITPRKSLTLKFPDIPPDFIPHFIRGYFDGDGYCRFRNGYINSNNMCIPQLEFSMLGTLDVVSKIKKYINTTSGTTFGNIEYQKESNIFRLTFCGTTSAKTFGDIIYSNSTIHLYRKKKVFDKWNEISGLHIGINEYTNIIQNYKQKTYNKQLN